MRRPRASALQARVLTGIPEVDDFDPGSMPSSLPPRPLAAVEPEPAPMQPQRTPARQRLADAIENIAALGRELAEAGAAKFEAEERQHVAFRAKLDAEEAERHARPHEDKVWTPGNPPAPKPWGGTYGTEEEAERGRRLAERPPLSIAEAKAALGIATDAYDSARRAVHHYSAQIDRLAERANWARHAIELAVRGVVQADPATLALANECRRLTTRAKAAQEAFKLILDHHVVQAGSPFYGWDKAADALTSPDAMADWSVCREWREVLEALVSDPDVPLPMPPVA